MLHLVYITASNSLTQTLSGAYITSNITHATRKAIRTGVGLESGTEAMPAMKVRCVRAWRSKRDPVLNTPEHCARVVNQLKGGCIAVV